jgi:hypothetical protein
MALKVKMTLKEWKCAEMTLKVKMTLKDGK